MTIVRQVSYLLLRTRTESGWRLGRLVKWHFSTESLGRLAKAGLRRGPTERDV